jgi:hypothetical protein
VELYIYSFNTPSWRGAQFKTAQGQGQLVISTGIMFSEYCSLGDDFDDDRSSINSGY